jgi:ribonuclease P protein component
MAFTPPSRQDDTAVTDNRDVLEVSSKLAPAAADHRLRKHADYQRVYREGHKNFSASMSYFFAIREASSPLPNGPRIGLTAGKVLGKAVERNRIKRRLRDIVRRHAAIVNADVDIVLHPRRSVLIIEFAKLESEVQRIFNNIQSMIASGKIQPRSPRPRETKVSS